MTPVLIYNLEENIQQKGLDYNYITIRLVECHSQPKYNVVFTTTHL